MTAAPGRLDIQVNRGTTLLELGRYDEAIAAFDAVLVVIRKVHGPGQSWQRLYQGQTLPEALAAFE